VLNALRHQRNWNFLPQSLGLTPFLCAQRLTASKELERLGELTFRLNEKVLNALRHQRNWNLQAIPKQFSPEACSTPYGIKGIGTAVAGTPSQSGTVEENTSTSWTWTIFPATYC
jgi:hypothetical protein